MGAAAWAALASQRHPYGVTVDDNEGCHEDVSSKRGGRWLCDAMAARQLEISVARTAVEIRGSSHCHLSATFVFGETVFQQGSANDWVQYCG